MAPAGTVTCQVLQASKNPKNRSSLWESSTAGHTGRPEGAGVVSRLGWHPWGRVKWLQLHQNACMATDRGLGWGLGQLCLDHPCQVTS
jgi:hypothetical protein